MVFFRAFPLNLSGEGRPKAPSIQNVLMPTAAFLEGPESTWMLGPHVLLVSLMAFAEFPAGAPDIERPAAGIVAPVAGRPAVSGMTGECAHTGFPGGS
jgi:hypothetical protein